MVAVVVELRALVELLDVLDGEGMPAEHVGERVDLVVAGRVQVQPEELLATQQLADLGGVDALERPHAGRDATARSSCGEPRRRGIQSPPPSRARRDGTHVSPAARNPDAYAS